MSEEVTPNDMPGAGAETEPSERAEHTAVAADTEVKAAPPNPTDSVDFWKKKARDQESRAKSNFEDAQKWRDLLDKTGGDKKDKDYDPRAAIEELQKKFETSERERTRAQVGRDYPDVPLKHILGDTEDEMRESAEELKSLLAAKAPKTAPAAAPAAEVTSDKKVDGPKQLTQDDLKTMSPKQILEARNNGQLDDLIGK